MSNYITSDCIKVSRERANRAWQYIQDFERETNSFLALKPYETISDIHMEGNEYVTSFRIKIRQPAPIQLRLIASDVIHNLDSILDNISYALFKRKFPLFNTPSDFDKATRLWLAKTSTDINTLMHHLQPYKATNGDPETHPLRRLRRLSGWDKHQLPMLLAIGILGIGFGYRNGTGIRLKRSYLSRGLQDGSEIAAWASTNLKAVQHLHPNFTFDIAFKGMGVAETARFVLINIHNFIRDEVIAKFKPFMIK